MGKICIQTAVAACLLASLSRNNLSSRAEKLAAVALVQIAVSDTQIEGELLGFLQRSHRRPLRQEKWDCQKS
jgi:hypothetical protein